MKEKVTNYERSNSITEVKLNKFSKVEYNRLLACGVGIEERRKAAQKLVDYLCCKFGIVTVPVVVYNRCQPHSIGGSGKLKGKTLGRYWHNGSMPLKIEVWNKTAIKQQDISIKVFTDTLLHEFMHHYDTTLLNLDTIHSAGFYKRITDLQNKLKS